MKSVVIVGANGFIGSNLTSHLSRKDYQVKALVDARFCYNHLKKLQNVDCIEFQLENLESLYDDKRFYQIDCLYHFAWVGVNARFRNNDEVQLQNIHFSLKVLKFCEHHKIKKVLIPGSAAELSCGDGVISGLEAPSPSDMYSATKVATRYVCQTYAMQHDMDLIWMLITSIYGPGRDDNNLLSYTIKTLLKGEKPSFTGLEQKWDYLYVDDLMEALEALGNKGIGGRLYPIASGTHHKMRDYVEIIRNMIDSKLPLGIGEIPYKNPNKIDNQVFDISQLTKDTGFKAKIDFQTGIRNTIEYFKSL